MTLQQYAGYHFATIKSAVRAFNNRVERGRKQGRIVRRLEIRRVCVAINLPVGDIYDEDVNVRSFCI